MNIPENLLFTKEHEWVRIDNDKAVLGITDYAQEQLGDITYVELPELGAEVKANSELAVIESVKAASDVYSPISGTVEAVNDELNTSPEKINQSPYEDGWICTLTDVDAEEIKKLMTASEYEEFLGEE